jgi:hypothetical protein
MARKARIHIVGVSHHIMARGIEGKDIFIDDVDRTTFLELLSLSFSLTGHHCYAWTLLPNHYLCGA